MNTLDVIAYVENNKMIKEANILANKVGGDIYMACLILYKNIPQTDKNIKMCKEIVKQNKKREKEWFNWFINGGYRDC